MARNGLLGEHLGHSYSPQIHARLGSAPYALFEVAPSDVEDFIRSGHWDGINVTIPYKREAARLADERSPRVEALGAANTLIRRPDGTIFAENTDVLGFSWMLEHFCREKLGGSPRQVLEGREAVILGTGGASQAVRYALEEYAGAKVARISRTGDDTYETLAERHSNAMLVVNTTPVGMYPTCPESPVDEETLASMKDLKGILDVVYNPNRTGICMLAEQLSIPCESGLPMLVAQALYASELFQGTDLDDSIIESIIDELSSKMRNICLIGMPGCGKSTTGRQLARMISRSFVDLDDAFTLRFDATPADIIRTQGEAAFRAMETQVCAEYASRSGLVIATGGGIVTQQANYPLLHQNSTIVFLDRAIDALPTQDRPLSQSTGVAALAEKRLPLYRAWADTTIACTGSPRGDAEAIRSVLGI